MGKKRKTRAQSAKVLHGSIGDEASREHVFNPEPEFPVGKLPTTDT